MKYFKNTSWLFGERILRMFVRLFVGIWVARYLGPEQFGFLSYAISFVGLFAAIATLGLDGIVVRALVKDDSRSNDLIGTSFWLKFTGAFVVLALLAIAVIFTSNDQYENTLIFIIASSTIFQSFNVVDFYFQAKVLSKYVVYANVFSLLLSSIVKIVLILSEAPLIAFAWVILFDSVVLALGFIYFFLKKYAFDIKGLKFSKSTAVDLLRDSWPLVLSGIVISIYMKIDQVMIKEMLDSEAVGQYAAAVKISEAWYFVPVVIASSLFPSIQNSINNIEEYRTRVLNLLNLLYLLAIPVVVFVIIQANEIVFLLFGDEYAQASNILSIHIFASIFVFLGVGKHYWILAENFQKYEFYSLFFGAAVNILLNLLLINRYGIIGAALATLTSQMIANIFIIYFIKETRYIAIQQIKTILFLNIKEMRNI